MRQTKNAMDDLIQKNLTDNYRKYYWLAYSYVYNEVDAMDTVQEGTYKAILKSGLLENPGYVGTWIYRIMVNEALFFIRGQKHPLEELNEGFQPSAADQYEDIDLKRAIEQLGEPGGTITELRFYEDMKLEQIADILDENLNSTESRLYRSLKRLRFSLE